MVLPRDQLLGLPKKDVYDLAKKARKTSGKCVPLSKYTKDELVEYIIQGKGEMKQSKSQKASKKPVKKQLTFEELLKKAPTMKKDQFDSALRALKLTDPDKIIQLLEAFGDER